MGIDFRDVYEREGRPPYTTPPPAVVGVEGAGTVVGTGERVAWLDVAGSYAGRVAARRDKLVPVPDGVAADAAAAVMLQGCTAQYLVADSCPVVEGDWAVVHGAADGVGLLLTQLVRARGGHVLATTSTEEKAGLARAAGADPVVVGYHGFADLVRELSGGGGAAVVYDGVGRTTFAAGLTALRPTGRMILFGAASGHPEPLELPQLAAHGSLYVQRPTLVTYTRTPQMLRERAGAVLDLAPPAGSTCASGDATRWPTPGPRTNTSRGGGRPASSCCCPRRSRPRGPARRGCHGRRPFRCTNHIPGFSQVSGSRSGIAGATHLGKP